MPTLVHFRVVAVAAATVLPLCAWPAWAAGKGHAAHVHGQVQAQVVVDGNTLLVSVQMPLDTLLGFEHRPRTPAQLQAANNALSKIKRVQDWIKPDPAAQCNSVRVALDDQALQPANSTSKNKQPEPEHADIDVSVELKCSTINQLSGLDLTLATIFKRVQRIDVQVAGPQGQSQQTLRAHNTRIKLRR